MEPRLQSFRIEIQPDGAQQRRLRQYLGCCRFVRNRALALQKERHERKEKILSYVEMAKLLTPWRHDPDRPWVAEAPCDCQQQALMDLGKAFQNFFKGKARYPRFHKKGRKDSMRFPNPKSIHLEPGNRRIFLTKLGWIRYREKRRIVGQIRSVTLSWHAGRWFVSILTRREVRVPVHQGGAIGIDVGVARFATLSDGQVVRPCNSFRKHELALRKAQQSMSRKKKGSANWKKARAKVQRVQARIGNVRQDFLHKISRTISKNHAVVCVEDLKVQNMTRSASGTLEEPGKNVRAKAGLNKAILDQGWGTFRVLLAYKTQWMGGRLIAVPPKNTSRRCLECGHTSGDNRKTQETFQCVECGYEENADLVGARNVLRAGQALLVAQKAS